MKWFCLSTCFFFVISSAVFGQNEEEIFPDDVKELQKIIFGNLRYPPTAREAHLQGKVVLKFKINQGKIDSLSVINSVCESIDNEAIKALMRTNGKWLARTNQFVLVSVVFYLEHPDVKTLDEVLAKRDKAIKKNDIEKSLQYCDEIRRRNPFDDDNLGKLVAVYETLNQHEKALEIERLRLDIRQFRNILK